ncbi:Zinc finger, RING-type [Sesbania bispinosa]|nr:Zinc finger, RING-type [Sesbania bispinosa]
MDQDLILFLTLSILALDDARVDCFDGYDIGCVLNLLLLCGRYYQLHVTQGEALNLSDVEQQRTMKKQVSTLLGYNMRTWVSSAKGASEDQISQIPSWRYKVALTNLDLSNDSESSERLINEDPECCICLAKYKDKEEVRQLPCSHLFHLKCVDQWLRIISCCPLCKQGLQR